MTSKIAKRSTWTNLLSIDSYESSVGAPAKRRESKVLRLQAQYRPLSQLCHSTESLMQLKPNDDGNAFTQTLSQLRRLLIESSTALDISNKRGSALESRAQRAEFERDARPKLDDHVSLKHRVTDLEYKLKKHQNAEVLLQQIVQKQQHMMSALETKVTANAESRSKWDEERCELMKETAIARATIAELKNRVAEFEEHDSGANDNLFSSIMTGVIDERDQSRQRLLESVEREESVRDELNAIRNELEVAKLHAADCEQKERSTLNVLNTLLDLTLAEDEKANYVAPLSINDASTMLRERIQVLMNSRRGDQSPSIDLEAIECNHRREMSALKLDAQIQLEEMKRVADIDLEEAKREVIRLKALHNEAETAVNLAKQETSAIKSSHFDRFSDVANDTNLELVREHVRSALADSQSLQNEVLELYSTVDSLQDALDSKEKELAAKQSELNDMKKEVERGNAAENRHSIANQGSGVKNTYDELSQVAKSHNLRANNINVLMEPVKHQTIARPVRQDVKSRRGMIGPGQNRPLAPRRPS